MGIGALSQRELDEIKQAPVALGWPLDASIERRITSPFGNRVHPIHGIIGWHSGIDIAADQGTSVLAPFGGRVTALFCDQDHGGGCTLCIDGTDGQGRPWRVGFAHLSASFVQVGDAVRRGQLVASSGGTPGTPGAGRSTGPHLHMTLKCRGTAIDPLGGAVTWLEQKDASGR